MPVRFKNLFKVMIMLKKFCKASTAYFTVFQSVYWGANCLCFSYMVPMLASKGYNEYQIGILMMINTGGRLFQLLWGVLCNGIFNIKYVFVTLIAMSIVSAICLTESSTFLLSAFFMLLLSATLYAPSNLIDAWSVKLINQGERINYGVSRGSASASYAAVALVYGIAVGKLGMGIIAYTYSIAAVILIAVASFSKVPQKEHPGEKISTMEVIKILIRNRRYSFFIIAAFIAFTTFGASITFFPILLDSFNIGNAYLGTAFSIMTFSEALMMAVFFRKIKKFGDEYLLIFAIAMMALKSILFAIAPGAIFAITAQILQALGTGIFFPAAVRYISTLVDDRCTIAAQTIYGAASVGLGAMAGNYFGGMIAGHIGVRPMLLISGIIALTAIIVFAGGIKFRLHAKSL